MDDDEMFGPDSDEEEVANPSKPTVSLDDVMNDDADDDSIGGGDGAATKRKRDKIVRSEGSDRADSDGDDADDDAEEGNDDNEVGSDGDDMDGANSTGKRRKNKGVSVGENDSDNSTGAPKKKLKKTGKKAEKMSKQVKKNVASKFSAEAVESSDDESNGSEEEEEEEEEGAKNEYDMTDGFVVFDGDDSDEDLFDKKTKGAKKKTQLKRLKKGKTILDEDDLALVMENRADAEGAVDDADEGSVAGSDISTQRGPRRSQGLEDEGDLDGQDVGDRALVYGDDDEMDGFIVDELDEEDGSQEGDKDGKRTKKQTVPVRRPRRVDPMFKEEDYQDAIDIFGEEYDDEEFDDDAEPTTEGEGALSSLSLIRNQYDIQDLRDGFFTEIDEKISRTDKPERFLSLITASRQPPDTEERLNEARWMASKLAARIVEEEMSSGKFDKTEETLSGELIAPIVDVLAFIQRDLYEVPFIWTYRRDYLHPSMKRKHLWMIMSWDEKWEVIYLTRHRIDSEVSAIKDAAQSSDDSFQREERASQIRQLKVSQLQLKRQTEDAKDDWERACDIIEEKDREDREVEAEDRENAENAKQVLENLQSRLDEVSLQLTTVLKEQEKELERHQKSRRYRKDAAGEVLSLFPWMLYMPIIQNSMDELELKDLFGFFQLLASTAEADGRGANAEEGRGTDPLAMLKVDGTGDEMEEEDPAATAAATAQPMRSRKVAGDNAYKRYRRAPDLRNFIDKFAVPAASFGDGLRHGFKVEPPLTPSRNVLDTAADYVDGIIFKSAEEVIAAAKLVLRTELAAEPNVRKLLRERFRMFATINTLPTPKGRAAIGPFSEYFGIHFLENKPIGDLFRGLDKTLYCRLKKAEAEGLVTISIRLPLKKNERDELEEDIQPLLDASIGASIAQHFFPTKSPVEDPFPSERAAWDMLREQILEDLTLKHIIPSLKEELHRELLRAGKETIVEEAADSFATMLSVGSYRKPTLDPRDSIKELLRSCPDRPNYFTVASIFFAGDRQPMFLAFVDKVGVVRAHDILPERAMSKKFDKIKQFIMDQRPDVIVLNSSGGNISRSVLTTLEKTLLRDIESEIQIRARERRESREALGDHQAYEQDDDETLEYKPSVLMIKDKIATIFQSSPRAKSMFPDFQPGTCAAVCLARFIQEPLAEYCGMWTCSNAKGEFGFETLFLDLHPLVGLLGRRNKGPLLRALERVLVDSVCDVGVDINMAVPYDHYAPMLAFVGGMGLRKAKALRLAVRYKLINGKVVSRAQLLEQKLLGHNVWNNAVGFLKVADIDEDRIPNPLDNTRIHPECYSTYDFAPKICADALEVESNSNDYFDVVIRLMKAVKRDLEKRMSKSNRWVDLWKGERPVIGKTTYTETVKTADGHLTTKEYAYELQDHMSQLLLDEYTAELEKSGHGKRKIQFDQIKEELRFPWLDLRKSIETLSPNEMFYIVTGESDTSLYVGLHIGCTVLKIMDNPVADARTGMMRRKQKAKVRTDSGLFGSIGMHDVLDERFDEDSFSMADHVSENQYIPAVVVGINKTFMHVDLSIKPSHLQQTEDWWLAKRREDRQARRWFEEVAHKNVDNLFDRYFQEDAALAAYREALEEFRGDAPAPNASRGTSQQPKSKSAPRAKFAQRHVRHPLFHNVSYAEAVTRLQEKPVGDVIIRPSSKGPDCLSITWLFQPNWCMHIDVEERNKKAGQLGLGDQLIIKYGNLQDEPYSDLDEIYSRFIEPMNDFVSTMVNYRKFVAGTQEEVERDLKEQVVSNPGSVPYAIRFHSLPGMFILTWIQNINSSEPVKTAPIRILPTGYLLDKVMFSTPRSLINYFKDAISQKPSSGSSASSSSSAAAGAGAGAGSASRRKSRFSARPASSAAPAPQSGSGLPPPSSFPGQSAQMRAPMQAPMQLAYGQPAPQMYHSQSQRY